MDEVKYVLTSNGELYHAYKYIKREKVNGKWVYTYPDDVKNNKKASLLDKVKGLFSKKSTEEKTASSSKAKAEDTVKKGENVVTKLFSKKVETTKSDINKTIQKGLDAINKIIPTVSKTINEVNKNNKYIVNRDNREAKIAEIEKTKEWQDIVKRSDPEYVKKDAEGNVKYLIDDYIVKKKHPELDLLDDIANGRNLTLNEITVESLSAAAADYVRTGSLVVGAVSQALLAKFKFSQGAYKEQEQELARLVTNGSNYVVDSLSTAKSVYDQVDKEKLANTAKNVAEQVNTVKQIDKTKLADAAQNIIEQLDQQELSNALQNLSEEELRKLLKSIT